MGLKAQAQQEHGLRVGIDHALQARAGLGIVVPQSGADAVAVTVSAKIEDAVVVPSLTVSVRTVVPDCPGAGVTVIVRLAPDPPNTMFATGTSVGFDELPLRVKLAVGVSRSPIVRGSGPTARPMLVV